VKGEVDEAGEIDHALIGIDHRIEASLPTPQPPHQT
jgi:hypothetical protein